MKKNCISPFVLGVFSCNLLGSKASTMVSGGVQVVGFSPVVELSKEGLLQTWLFPLVSGCVELETRRGRPR